MVCNFMCDGHGRDRCTSATSEVRVYSIGSGGNLILCRACWDHENRYNAQRQRETGNRDAFPLRNWATADKYGEQS